MLPNGKIKEMEYENLDKLIRQETSLPGLDDPQLLVQYIVGIQDSLNVNLLFHFIDCKGGDCQDEQEEDINRVNSN